MKASGGSDALWVAFDYLVGPLVIAILVTRKHGMGNWSWLERSCVAGSVVGAFIWWRFNSPEVCFSAVLAIDCMGAIPTVWKAIKTPSQESWIPWAIFTVGSAFNIGATTGNVYEIAYVWAILIVDLSILIPLLVPRKTKV